MHRGPPRPRPSSLPVMVTTSTPACRSMVFVSLLRSYATTRPGDTARTLLPSSHCSRSAPTRSPPSAQDPHPSTSERLGKRTEQRVLADQVHPAFAGRLEAPRRQAVARPPRRRGRSPRPPSSAPCRGASRAAARQPGRDDAARRHPRRTAAAPAARRSAVRCAHPCRRARCRYRARGRRRPRCFAGRWSSAVAAVPEREGRPREPRVEPVDRLHVQRLALPSR